MVSFSHKYLNKFNLLRYFTSSTTKMKNPIVTVREGKLRGAVDSLYNGLSFYSFKGIPYANPPIGKLRFKAPLPLKPWEGIYDAIEHGAICPQIDMQNLQVYEGDENCLFLNVYTPSLQSDSRLPVMVYFHGGGFMSGSGNSELYGPRFLIQHNVILVTVNYRLGILGFLCLDTPDIPGNAGMKDQVAALRWIQRNIANFGGDPNNVTIFGESAGASSVTYHMLSPMSKGLFHKAIAQSGVCTIDWAFGKGSKERAFRAAKIFGKDAQNTDELVEFLQNLPAVQLAEISMKTGTADERQRGLPIHFTPVAEKKFQDNEWFLEDDPVNLLLAGKVNKVPVIVGYNSAEALFLSRRYLKKAPFYNKYPGFLVPRDIAERISQEKLLEYGKRIKHFYFGDKDIDAEDVEKMCDLLSDLHFVFGAHRFANLCASSCESTYMYRFNCNTQLNFLKILFNLTSYEGACHVDDQFYIFDSATNAELYEKDEKSKYLVDMITKLLTDFAKFGNPTPDNTWNLSWSPYTLAGKEYLSIDQNLSMGKAADAVRVEFWTKLFNEAGLPSRPKSNL